MQTLIDPIDNDKILRTLSSWDWLVNCIDKFYGLEFDPQPDPDDEEAVEEYREWEEELKAYSTIERYRVSLSQDCLKYCKFYKIENGYKVDVWFDYFGATMFFDEEGLLHSDTGYAIRDYGVEHEFRIYAQHGQYRQDIPAVQDWVERKAWFYTGPVLDYHLHDFEKPADATCPVIIPFSEIQPTDFQN